jgi:integral membrane protein
MFEDKKIALHKVGMFEGISFIVLLFIAMPLKYMMGIAIATKIVGMIHGGLFLWFLFTLYEFHKQYNIGMKFNAIAFICSIVPFGWLYLDKKINDLD